MFFISVKLNGGRHVTGVLRGFDPFMNLVLDEAVEEVSAKEKHNIGMVVRKDQPFFEIMRRMTSFFPVSRDSHLMGSFHTHYCYF